MRRSAGAILFTQGSPSPSHHPKTLVTHPPSTTSRRRASGRPISLPLSDSLRRTRPCRSPPPPVAAHRSPLLAAAGRRVRSGGPQPIPHPTPPQPTPPQRAQPPPRPGHPTPPHPAPPHPVPPPTPHPAPPHPTPTPTPPHARPPSGRAGTSGAAVVQQPLVVWGPPMWTLSRSADYTSERAVSRSRRALKGRDGRTTSGPNE